MAELSEKGYAERLKLYDELVSRLPNIERKGATMPYTSVNGHMFSLFTKEGNLTLRLPSPQREQFLEEFDTELSVQYGAVMKEYVVVPLSLLKNTDQLLEHFKQSYQYAQSLKPK